MALYVTATKSEVLPSSAYTRRLQMRQNKEEFSLFRCRHWRPLNGFFSGPALPMIWNIEWMNVLTKYLWHLQIGCFLVTTIVPSGSFIWNKIFMTSSNRLLPCYNYRSLWILYLNDSKLRSTMSVWFFGGTLEGDLSNLSAFETFQTRVVFIASIWLC